MVIDVHAHLVPVGLPDFAARTNDDRWPRVEIDADGAHGRILLGARVYREMDPGYWSLGHRLEQLDRLGIDVQVLSPLPILLPTWDAGEPGAAWCRAVNEATAAAVAAGRGRYRGLAILPAYDVGAAIAEVGRVRSLGLSGVQVATAVDAARTFADASIDPILRALADAGLAVLLHPVRRGVVAGLAGSLEAAVGLPVDTTQALVRRLSSSSVPMPHVCAVHCGGTLPWAWPRLRAVGTGWGELPRWLHVDTAAADRRQVDYLVELFGSDRVAFGSDCPAAREGPIAELLRSCGDLRASEAVFGTNGDALFPAVGTATPATPGAALP